MKFAKKLVLVVAVASVAMLMGLSTASAQDAPYGMAGCGLGSMVLGSGGGIMQIFAATTNGTSGNQTFGITFGTSNCVERGVVREDAEQEAFFEMNYDNIKADMAAGQGEHLEAVSSLLGCSEDVQSEIASFTQQNYETIIPTQSTTPNQALYTYKMELSRQETFARSCNRL